MRLGILASHPIQYQAPLFKVLARRMDLHVFFAHSPTPQQQAIGFGGEFRWDVDLVSGYRATFLENRSSRPSTDAFFGCDTPQVGDAVREGKFDAFLVMGWYLKSYLQAMRACRANAVPLMVRGDSQLSTQRSPLKAALKSWIFPWMLRRFDACLYVGRRNREYLQHYGVPAEKLWFAPHCVDNQMLSARAEMLGAAQARQRLDIDADAEIVLFAGKLLERKRPLDAIRAVATLRRSGRDVRLVVAGDGPLRGEACALADGLGVPVKILGFCNQSLMPTVYRASDLLVLPSASSETWGLVVNEALACGTPVVVSDDCGCAPDLAITGKTGRSYRGGDVEDLTQAIDDVLRRPPSAAAMQQMVDRYSLDAAADGIQACLTALSERKSRRH